ncbi:hypothetical protein Pmani_026507 [Petrolisthes manimaculis]|uniref:Uncharacterized protein n=1 Tax=Petrolisthes manimaculis TaxID=1843537 RepID=A0AAE1P5W8_9EUCA|nr:hypothetical protein Pmani_026507 [Petrolisthes manimaculis]
MKNARESKRMEAVTSSDIIELLGGFPGRAGWLSGQHGARYHHHHNVSHGTGKRTMAPSYHHHNVSHGTGKRTVALVTSTTNVSNSTGKLTLWRTLLPHSTSLSHYRETVDTMGTRALSPTLSRIRETDKMAPATIPPSLARYRETKSDPLSLHMIVAWPHLSHDCRLASLITHGIQTEGVHVFKPQTLIEGGGETFLTTGGTETPASMGAATVWSYKMAYGTNPYSYISWAIATFRAIDDSTDTLRLGE